jgi:hypothetical protein
MSIRESDWMPLRGIDQGRLSEARLQAHYAVQWLGRAARAYVPPQPDDEHTNLGWDGALDGFTTHPLKDGAWLSLKITDLTLALHVGEGRTQVQSFSLDGRSDAQARQWLSEQLGARGRLVIPIGDEQTQTLFRVSRSSSGFEKEQLGECKFVKLFGKYGWRN